MDDGSKPLEVCKALTSHWQDRARSLRIMEHDSSCIIDQDAQRRPRGRAGHNVLLRKWPKCIKLGLATFLSGTDQGLQGCFKAPVAIPVEGKDS